ncbi:cupin domain-containing protein [Spongiibacter tropicus]|uniref:cupin domain-containing protein n=1 Tax=Spongiibacter tropicus TaxID=454602 RepID=UPI0003B6F10D|nr:cupin domain-containing protein [Spongiibacter tropicus]
MSTLPDSPEALIAALDLEAHPEGGFFRRHFTSSRHAVVGDEPRAMMSCIYYLLTEHSPIGCLHSNRSDIVHFWQGGGALQYTLLTADGALQQTVLGPDLATGQQLQLVVPGGWWKASRLLSGRYGLISEAVCPGFDYGDHRFADAEQIRRDYPQLFPQHWPLLQSMLRS